MVATDTGTTQVHQTCFYQLILQVAASWANKMDGRSFCFAHNLPLTYLYLYNIFYQRRVDIIDQVELGYTITPCMRYFTSAGIDIR